MGIRSTLFNIEDVKLFFLIESVRFLLSVWNHEVCLHFIFQKFNHELFFFFSICLIDLNDDYVLFSRTKH